MRLSQQSVKREKQKAKINNNQYQELTAEVQRKLREDKKQQLEGMCVELEAANNNNHLTAVCPGQPG